MSWIQQLYDTYERCAGHEPVGELPLMPIGHTKQQAHIEVCIDSAGCFKSAQVLSPRIDTIVPATEKSAGRTSGEAAHPLADKIQYCAGDYLDFGGKKPSYFDGYVQQLRRWCHSPFAHPKAQAVLSYVERGTLVADLLSAKVLHAQDGILLIAWPGNTDTPEIFRQLVAKPGNGVKVQDQGDALVRWRVVISGGPQDHTWEDASLFQAWIDFDASNKQRRGLCLVSGEDTWVAEQHPSKLRHGGDKAKLISSNDAHGYTFRGRFETSDQACSVGFETSQKAHNALRWLLAGKRTTHNDTQAIIAWETSGQDIPDPWSSSDQLLANDPYDQQQNAGSLFAQRLKKAIAGYRSNLGDAVQIVVMALDAATPGRMAIAYYRELSGSDFLARIEHWHTDCAWPMNYGKEHRFTGAPAPKDIAEAAYGHDLINKDKSKKLLKSTVERLLPCIVDGLQIPRDLMHCALNRACQPQSMLRWEWNKVLGIACALYKGSHPQENYLMSLETERATRDYLYGRLLAVAEHMENRALHFAGETRDTNAAKLLSRFANHPYNTWLQLEIALSPYKSRLRTQSPGTLVKLEKLSQDIMNAFIGDDFRNDKKLSGEFLLAYHCQTRELWQHTGASASTVDSASQPVEVAAID